MSGSIRKCYLTQEVFANYSAISEIYVDADFKWENKSAAFYVKEKGALPLLSIVTRLTTIWGTQNVKLRVAQSFDSLILNDKRLVFADGKWVDV